MQVYSCQRYFPYCSCLPRGQSAEKKLEDVTHKLQSIAKRAANLQSTEHMPGKHLKFSTVSLGFIGFCSYALRQGAEFLHKLKTKGHHVHHLSMQSSFNDMMCVLLMNAL